jgi:hypothetical protein
MLSEMKYFLGNKNVNKLYIHPIHGSKRLKVSILKNVIFDVRS